MSERDIQLEAVFFKDRDFVGKIVTPQASYVDDIAQAVIAAGKTLFAADGWRVTYGPHNATSVKEEHNAPPVDSRSGVAHAIPILRVGFQ